MAEKKKICDCIKHKYRQPHTKTGHAEYKTQKIEGQEPGVLCSSIYNKVDKTLPNCIFLQIQSVSCTSYTLLLTEVS